MNATLHLILGPPGSPRADRLLDAYRDASTGFGIALILVPTRRHADQLRDSLGTCLAPLIYDIQSFADELIRVHEPTRRPHCDTDRRLLLDSILADLRANDLPYFAGVAQTRGFAEAATGYVAELKDAGVDLRTLLKLNPGRESGAGTRHHQATRIFDRYHRRLAKQHRFDPTDRLGRAAKLWLNDQRQPFDRVRSVFITGFTLFTPFQRQLLDAVRETIDHFWIELPDGEGDEFTAPRAVAEWLSGMKHRTLIRPEAETSIVPASPRVPLRHFEASGELGEARLVARHIRELLANGTRPDRVLVVARHFTLGTIDLFREVFGEYGIPHDAEGADSLGRAPAVAFLLRAWRLPDDDWEFAPVAAVLRSSFFRPNWPEVRADPEVPAKAETLLRMLGEARGRDAYLKAVATWERTPPEPLEDEQPEEPLRQRKQRLAACCRPFLERFFKVWDKLNSGGTAEALIARLKTFADDIGLSFARPDDAADLDRFWHELDRWARNESSTTTRKLARTERFARVLAAVASAPCCARTVRGRGVALLSAEHAVGLECDYLFLIGLGEGSWPDLSAPVSLLDDSERERLLTMGFTLSDPAARLGHEQLLFNSLVSAPKREVVLSYAAVDGKGQKLLPSSFLRELLTKSSPSHTAQQRMLLDGYFDQEPMSAAELRVLCAQTGMGSLPSTLNPDLIDNLSRAQVVARARFASDTFTPFDGELRHPAVTAELTERLGRDKVFSPTSLDNYIACPFRFLLQHVLRLEPLEDPSEEVKYTRRGSAFHRALARFHKQVNEILPAAIAGGELPKGLTDELVEHLAAAIEEYAARAPSLATAELWRLEGKRLKRAALRYREHWHKFCKPWREQNATPTPHKFEASFGVPGVGAVGPLVIAIGEVEVRIGGYIDRVDLVQLDETDAFWVIDYKTGRATNYQASHVERFEKLQLPLYALAVERVILGSRKARPLGLAYWLVTDTGAKTMLPTKKAQSWLADAEAWPKFRDQLEAWVSTLATHIRMGDFPLAPRSETCTDTCGFGSVCRIAQSRNTGKVFALELPLV